MAGFGVGANLVSMGQEQLGEATKGLKEAADEESKRNAQNTLAEESRKQGNQQLGGTIGALGGMAIGAQYGSALGPWGAIIGGAAGALAGRLF
jgi:uncharacterized protein YcfJ